MSEFLILVVEDEADSADVMARMLRSVGVDTILCGSAEHALEELGNTQNTFDCIVIDLALPGMDGFELMQVIRDEPDFQNLPLIAVTAFHTPELRVNALDSGFDGYFAKPLDTNLFMQTLERFLS